MTRRHSVTIVALFVVFAVLPLMAQSPDEPLPLPDFLSNARPPEPQDPTPGEAPMPQRELKVLARATSVPGLRTNANYSGTNGELLFDAPPSPYGTGVLLRAFTTTPNIFMQLGTFSAASSFQVRAADDTAFFTIRGDGYGILRRDYDFATVFEINNANPGTSTSTASRSLRFHEGATLKAAVTSAGSGSTTAAGGANAMQIWNYANAPTVFSTNSTERVRIGADGKVGIGTTGGSGRLTIVETADSGIAHSSIVSTAVEGNANQLDYGSLITAYQSVNAGVTNTGRVIGSYVEAYKLGSGYTAYAFGIRARSGIASGHSGTIADVYAVHAGVDSGSGTVTNGYGVYIADTQAVNDYGVYQAGANDSNYFAGNVGIGTQPTTNALEVAGNANFTGTVTGGNIQAKYQDVAEWVEATGSLDPGSVVIVASGVTNVVTASASAYDTRVAGVVSLQPGLILGEAGASKVMVATTGRVKVKVDATRAPIRTGDLLVTSDTPGTAMKSIPIELQGVSIHRPGTIVGKALEQLESGEGEILVLLSLQ